MNTIIEALEAKGWKKLSDSAYEKNGAAVVVTETDVTIYPGGEWIPEQYSVSDFKATPIVGKFYIPRQELYVEFK